MGLAKGRCLTLAEGDVFVCWPEREAPSGWARGRNGGREGVFPLSYVRALRMVPPRSSLPLLEAAKKEEGKAAAAMAAATAAAMAAMAAATAAHRPAGRSRCSPCRASNGWIQIRGRRRRRC